jgi:aminobenzoyl-glutamate utilization protein B
MPEWSEEEQAFARELQANSGAKVEGLRTRAVRPAGEAKQRWSANDAGDVSWKTPMCKFYYPAMAPNLAAHHWAAGAPLATSIAHKAAASAARILAGAALDCMRDPALVAQARRTFEEELGGVRYTSLLPPDQKPPVDLNRRTMEIFRPMMAAHYLKEKPVFT